MMPCGLGKTISSLLHNQSGRIVRFLARIAFFATPLICGIAYFEVWMWRAGENWPITRVVESTKDAKADTLFGRRYFSQNFQALKYFKVKALRPAILVVGSSRVMQIRETLFNPHERDFYNAGGLIQSVADWTWYVEEVKRGHLPLSRHILVGADPWWFKDLYHRKQSESAKRKDRCIDGATVIAEHWLVMREVLRCRIDLRWRSAGRSAGAPTPYNGRAGIGAAALDLDCGFRADGSYQYEPSLLRDYLNDPRYFDREIPPVIERVRSGKKQFSRPVEWSTNALHDFISAACKLENMGAHVTVILPPFTGEVVGEIERTAELAGWWHAYNADLPRMLGAAGIDCYVAGSPSQYDLKDDAFYDGFHPGEVMMARIIFDMYSRPDQLGIRPVLDLDRLGALARERRACPLVLDLPPRILSPPFESGIESGAL